jgi:hypothetical protein
MATLIASFSQPAQILALDEPYDGNARKRTKWRRQQHLSISFKSVILQMSSLNFDLLVNSSKYNEFVKGMRDIYPEINYPEHCLSSALRGDRFHNA